MLSFKQFIKEYLTSDEKNEVSNWEKRTPEATKATDHFFGVGNEEHNEPLVNTGDKSEVHRAIERHLGQNISSDEYKSGMMKDKLGKQVRIGQAVSDPNLKNQFKSDNTRKNVKANTLSVRTTRSAEGVAGQTSHGQSWEDHSCKNFNSGCNRRYLKDEVKHGTVVSYLHDHEGREIARATFHPFTNAEGNTIYKRDSYYGLKHPEFEKHNAEMEKRLSQPHRGSSEYRIHPDVYNNSGIRTTLHHDEISKLLDDKNTSESKLREIAQNSNDPEVHKAIANHENAGDRALDAVARKSDDPEVHKAILKHENAGDRALFSLAWKSNDPEVHKAIVKHKNAEDYSLSAVAENSNDPEVHKAIVKHKNVGDNVLDVVAHHSNDPEVHKAILKHKNAGDNVLFSVAWKSNDPEVHRAIVKHKNAGDDSLFSVANKSDDPEVHQAIVKHKNADEYVLGEVARKSDDPEVHRAIVKHEKAGDYALSEVAHKSNDPEVHNAILKHKNAGDYALAAVTRKRSSK